MIKKLKYKITIFMIMKPILTWFIFFILFAIIRLYMVNIFVSAEDTIQFLVSKEAQFYGVEILNTCYNAAKDKPNLTQRQLITLFIETLNHMPNKDKWSSTDELKNLISVVLQLRSCQALANNNQDYPHLLLLQMSFHLVIDEDIKIIDADILNILFKSYHSLNEKLLIQLQRGYVHLKYI